MTVSITVPRSTSVTVISRRRPPCPTDLSPFRRSLRCPSAPMRSRCKKEAAELDGENQRSVGSMARRPLWQQLSDRSRTGARWIAWTDESCFGFRSLETLHQNVGSSRQRHTRPTRSAASSARQIIRIANPPAQLISPVMHVCQTNFIEIDVFCSFGSNLIPICGTIRLLSRVATPAEQFR